MCWVRDEFSGEISSDGTFTTQAGHTGVMFIAASGDSGAPPIWPAISPNVLAVGGTALTLNANDWSAETGWSGSGGGVSAYEPKPAYQGSLGWARRTNPDVAYAAAPSTA